MAQKRVAEFNKLSNIFHAAWVNQINLLKTETNMWKGREGVVLTAHCSYNLSSFLFQQYGLKTIWIENWFEPDVVLLTCLVRFQLIAMNHQLFIGNFFSLEIYNLNGPQRFPKDTKEKPNWPIRSLNIFMDFS